MKKDHGAQYGGTSLPIDDDPLAASIALSTRLALSVSAMLDDYRARFKELEGRIADLDDATPSRAAFEELHNRVDKLESRIQPLDARGRIA